MVTAVLGEEAKHRKTFVTYSAPSRCSYGSVRLEPEELDFSRKQRAYTPSTQCRPELVGKSKGPRRFKQRLPCCSKRRDVSEKPGGSAGGTFNTELTQCRTEGSCFNLQVQVPKSADFVEFGHRRFTSRRV